MNSLLSMILGAVLAVIGGFLGIMFQSYWLFRMKDRISRSFLEDLLRSFVSNFDQMDQLKKRVNYVPLDFLNQIERDFNFFERNREEILYIKNEALRKTVYEFFSTLSQSISILKFSIGQEVVTVNNPAVYAQAQVETNKHYDTLKDLRVKTDSLIAKL